MKKKSLILATSVCLIIGVGVTSTAHAGPLPSIKAMTMQVLTSLNNNKVEFCSKGDVTKGIFTIRSFNGALCNSRYFAAQYGLLCKKNIDYSTSQCFKNGDKVLLGLLTDHKKTFSIGTTGKLKDIIAREQMNDPELTEISQAIEKSPK